MNSGVPVRSEKRMDKAIFIATILCSAAEPGNGLSRMRIVLNHDLAIVLGNGNLCPFLFALAPKKINHNETSAKRRNQVIRLAPIAGYLLCWITKEPYNQC